MNVASVERAESSEVLDRGVRLGLIAYGVVHLLVAWTAFRLVFSGEEDGSASHHGALAQLASTPLGEGTLYVVAAGLLALALWQAGEALKGHRTERGGKRVRERLGSAGRALVYAALGASAVAMTFGSSGGGAGTDSYTARVMSMPGGQLLVAAVGTTVMVVGAVLAWRGLSRQFLEELDVGARVGGRRTPIVALGIVGHLGKGAAFVAVGVLFVVAAVQHQPRESGGLDQALHELLRQPFGGFLVTAVAAALAGYGLFCLAWSRHLSR